MRKLSKVQNSALPVITIMALWQLLNLGTGCTVTHCEDIYIYRVAQKKVHAFDLV